MVTIVWYHQVRVTVWPPETNQGGKSKNFLAVKAVRIEAVDLLVDQFVWGLPGYLDLENGSQWPMAAKSRDFRGSFLFPTHFTGESQYQGWQGGSP